MIKRLLSAALLPCVFAVACLAEPAAAVPEEPTVIECLGTGEISNTDTESTITFNDHVVVSGTNMKLHCDHLKVVIVRKGDPAATIGQPDKFKSLLATGNVRIVQGDREATCGKAVVLPGENKIVLSESPVVIDLASKSAATGEVITLLRGEQKAIITKMRITAPPVKDLGYDKNKPAN